MTSTKEASVPRFITLEGGEGAGKSTQIKLLAKSLGAAGIEVTITREPGGSPAAEEIRDLLVAGRIERWLPLSEVLLHSAARVEHVTTTIRPALESGRWVISDRFFDSTLAYQGYGHGVATEVIEQIRQITLGRFIPDLTLILDLPVDIGLSRAAPGAAARREDRYERMESGFHQRLREGFHAIAANQPERCLLIDARGDIVQTRTLILEAINSRFGLSLKAV